MMNDPIEILLAHDLWATRTFLERCAGLTEEQFHRRFEMGPGSLHDTITHMIGAMQTWRQTLAGVEPGARADQDGKKRTPADLLELLEITGREFGAEARRLPLDAKVLRVRQGKTFEFTRAVVLTHVATHGMHHRAQCLNMLRQMGVTPLPPSSVVEWSRMR